VAIMVEVEVAGVDARTVRTCRLAPVALLRHRVL
jgi:hypothetical protein